MTEQITFPGHNLYFYLQTSLPHCFLSPKIKLSHIKSKRYSKHRRVLRLSLGLFNGKFVCIWFIVTFQASLFTPDTQETEKYNSPGLHPYPSPSPAGIVHTAIRSFPNVSEQVILHIQAEKVILRLFIHKESKILFSSSF